MRFAYCCTSRAKKTQHLPTERAKHVPGAFHSPGRSIEADGADASTPTEGTATSTSTPPPPPTDGTETSPDTSGSDPLMSGTETLTSGVCRWHRDAPKRQQWKESANTHAIQIKNMNKIVADTLVYIGNSNAITNKLRGRIAAKNTHHVNKKQMHYEYYEVVGLIYIDKSREPAARQFQNKNKKTTTTTTIPSSTVSKIKHPRL